MNQVIRVSSLAALTGVGSTLPAPALGPAVTGVKRFFLLSVVY